MKKVGFIGAFDKLNLIMHVAKLLKYMNQRVLVIDTTILQKTKYVVPSISPTRTYITDLEEIDFAVGFENMEQITRYLGIPEEKLPYDYVLVDIDSSEEIEKFEAQDFYKKYYVTGFDAYSLRKGLSILENLKEPIILTKVLCRYELQKQDESYLDYLSMEYKVNWNEFSIYLPNLDEDNQTIEENQKVHKIRFKKLSGDFQEAIMYIVQDILEERSLGKIRKSIKE